MAAECSVAGCTECSAAGGAENFVIQDPDYSVAGGAEYIVAGGTECFWGAFFVDFAHFHPSLFCALPPSCKWGKVVPMSTFLQPA